MNNHFQDLKKEFHKTSFYKACQNQTLLEEAYAQFVRFWYLISSLSPPSHHQEKIQMEHFNHDLDFFEKRNLHDNKKTTLLILKFTEKVRQLSSFDSGFYSYIKAIFHFLALEIKPFLLQKKQSTSFWQGKMTLYHLSSFQEQPPRPGFQEGLQELFTLLHLLGQSTFSSQTSFTLNPMCGHNVLYTQKMWAQSIEQANKRAWNTFSYYPLRYGQKGWRFAQSDAHFIVSLFSLSHEVAKSQIHWLAKLLSCRGMPSILLETFLIFLFQELYPYQNIEKEKEILQILINSLQEERLKIFKEEDYYEAHILFTFALPLSSSSAQLGTLIASSYNDQHILKISNCEENITTWLQKQNPQWQKASFHVLEYLKARGALL